MKRMFIACAVLIVAVVVATPAMAQPLAGCGEGKNLDTVAATLEAVDDRIYTAEEWQEVVVIVTGVDKNGDGYLCWKHSKPNEGQDKHWIGPEDVGVSDYVITSILDNNAQGQS